MLMYSRNLTDRNKFLLFLSPPNTLRSPPTHPYIEVEAVHNWSLTKQKARYLRWAPYTFDTFWNRGDLALIRSSSIGKKKKTVFCLFLHYDMLMDCLTREQLSKETRTVRLECSSTSCSICRYPKERKIKKKIIHLIFVVIISDSFRNPNFHNVIYS